MAWKSTMNLSSILVGVLVFFLVVLFSAFVVVMWSENPTWIFKLVGVCQKYEVLKFLGIGMGGILLALQALASHRRAKAMEDAANQQAKATRNTEQGQRQERLKNAIEHLGHKSDSVRLGGAYELFHLAEDTPELCQTVLDILCAHIRRTTSKDEYRETHKSKPSEEIQSLLTLLFVRKHRVFNGLHVNLQGSWLNGADLREACFWKAILTQAHLKSVNLARAHLQRSNLVDAHLEDAFLEGAQLQGAVLTLAHLQGANLEKARVQGADLLAARLQAAYLAKANMQGVNLASARLQGATLSNTRLQGANLAFAGLLGAHLHRVCFEGAGSQAWSVSTPFADRITMSIGKETNLSRVWFGGIERGGADSLIEGLSSEKAKILQTILAAHIGKPLSHQLPKNSGAITGAYTKEEAEKWIAEYEKAMAELPDDIS